MTFLSVFTKENAREMQQRARAARIKQVEDLRNAVLIAQRDPKLDFAEKTLSRVRLQMERVADEIDRAIGKDSKKLRELTDAYGRLAEQEQKLAMRPSPGSFKPTTSKSRSRASIGGNNSNTDSKES